MFLKVTDEVNNTATRSATAAKANNMQHLPGTLLYIPGVYTAVTGSVTHTIA